MVDKNAIIGYKYPLMEELQSLQYLQIREQQVIISSIQERIQHLCDRQRPTQQNPIPHLPEITKAVQYVTTQYSIDFTNNAEFVFKESPAQRGEMLDIEPISFIARQNKDSVLRSTVSNLYNLSVATGLSTLDGSVYMDSDLSQIASHLKVGGHLLHVQDVGPGYDGVWHYLATHVDHSPIRYKWLEKTRRAVAFELPEGFVETTDIFRRSIAQAINNNKDLTLVMNNWVTVKSTHNSQVGYIEQSGVTLAKPGHPYNEVSVLITLARKI